MKTILTIKNATPLVFDKGTGFATGTWRFAGVGVFNYMWWELGLPYNEETNGVYRGYYSPESYDNPATLASFNNVPVTNDHPRSEDGLVDLTNWAGNDTLDGKRLSIGDTGAKTVFVDNGLENEFFIRDESAVASIIAETRDLSFGATTEVLLGRGETPEGEDYDLEFINITGNHIALVKRGRIPGSKVLVGETDLSNSKVLIGNSAGQRADGKFVITNSKGQPMELNSPSNREESNMTTDTNVQITVANTDLTLPNKKLADEVKAVFNSIEDAHKTELATLVTNHETALNAETEKVTAANAELTALKESVTPEAIALNAADRVAVLDKAKLLNIELKDADTSSNDDLVMQVLNGFEATKTEDFSECTPAIAKKVFNSLTAPTAPKAPNALAGKTVANSGTEDDVATTVRNSMQNPESRQAK